MNTTDQSMPSTDSKVSQDNPRWYHTFWEYTKYLLLIGLTGLTTYVATFSVFSDILKLMGQLGAVGQVVPIISGILTALTVLFTIFDQEDKVTGFFKGIKKHWKDLSHPEFSARYAGIIFGLLFTLSFFAFTGALLYFSLPFAMPTAIALATLATVLSASGAAFPIINFFKGLPARLSATLLRFTDPEGYKKRFEHDDVYKKTAKDDDIHADDTATEEDTVVDKPLAKAEEFKARALETGNFFLKAIFHIAAFSMVFVSATKRMLKLIQPGASKVSTVLVGIFLWLPKVVIEAFKKHTKVNTFTKHATDGQFFVLKENRPPEKEKDSEENDAKAHLPENESDEKETEKPLDTQSWNRAPWYAQFGLQGLSIGMGVTAGLTFTLMAAFPPAFLVPAAILTGVFTYIMAMSSFRKMYDFFTKPSEKKQTLEDSGNPRDDNEAEEDKMASEASLDSGPTVTPTATNGSEENTLTGDGDDLTKSERSRTPSPKPSSAGMPQTDGDE